METKKEIQAKIANLLIKLKTLTETEYKEAIKELMLLRRRQIRLGNKGPDKTSQKKLDPSPAIVEAKAAIAQTIKLPNRLAQTYTVRVDPSTATIVFRKKIE